MYEVFLHLIATNCHLMLYFMSSDVLELPEWKDFR